MTKEKRIILYSLNSDGCRVHLVGALLAGTILPEERCCETSLLEDLQLTTVGGIKLFLPKGARVVIEEIT